MNKIILPPTQTIYPNTISFEDCYTLGKQNTTIAFHANWPFFLFDFAHGEKAELLVYFSERLKWTEDGSFRYFASEVDYIETQFKIPSLFDFKNGNPPYIEVTPTVEHVFKLYRQNQTIKMTFFNFLKNSFKSCPEDHLITY